jgi:hypothetical protein
MPIRQDLGLAFDGRQFEVVVFWLVHQKIRCIGSGG